MNKRYFCKICKSDKVIQIRDHVRDSNEFSVYKCSSCGHVQIFPIPDYDNNKQFYDINRQASWVRPNIDIESMRRHLMTDIIRRTKYIEKHFQKNKKILDLGSGYGFFTEEMIKRGWNIYGLEISNSRRAIAEDIVKQKFLNFDVCEIEQIPQEYNHFFDVVVAFQVFEHILKPIEFLQGIKELLVPGGIVVIEVPNGNDHMLNICNEYIDFYFQKAHVSYFSANDLKKLLIKSGYQNIKIEYIQRYSVENAINWMDKGIPQIDSPSYESRKKNTWLDEYYKNYLLDKKITDTIMVIGTKK